MKSTTLPNRDAAMATNDHQPSSNTAAIITKTAVAGVTHVLESMQWSYDGVPTGGNLLVEIDSVTVFSVDITTAGPGFFEFPKSLHGAPSLGMVITLAAGGGGVTGKINAQTR